MQTIQCIKQYDVHRETVTFHIYAKVHFPLQKVNPTHIHKATKSFSPSPNSTRGHITCISTALCNKNVMVFFLRLWAWPDMALGNNLLIRNNPFLIQCTINNHCYAWSNVQTVFIQPQIRNKNNEMHQKLYTLTSRKLDTVWLGYHMQ